MHAAGSLARRPPIAVALVVAVAATMLALVPTARAHAQDPPFDRGIEQACPEGTTTTDPFSDVAPESTHSQAISCIWSYGITQGRFVDGESVFAPQRPVNREQMASFVAREISTLPADVYALPAPHDRALYDDAEDLSDAHVVSVNQLTDAGIVGGFADGTFRPRRSLQRDQMATFIAGAIETITGTMLDPAPVFDDIAGSIHRANIEKLAAIGVTVGKGGGAYAPDDTITRAQMASLLARTLDYLVASGLLLPPDVDPGEGGAQLGLVDVALGVQDGADRVTFTLEGDDRDAGWRVQYVDEAIHQGSGEVVEVDGDAILEVTLMGIAIPPDLPQDVQDDLVEQGTIPFDGEGIVEVVVGTVFEGHQQVFIGTTGHRPFTVERLDGPQRVYIDVAHAS